MKRYAQIALWVLMVCAVGAVNAAPATTTTQDTDDVKSFELTPVAPPTPALKYSFQYPYVERVPGNAAPLYLDAVLLMPPGAQEKAEQAWDAYAANDSQKFDKLAEELDTPSVILEIEQAGRRMTCDFNPPMREMAVNTLLPHLNVLIHGLVKSLNVRALQQIKQGKVDDAVTTLRQSYVLADNINEPVLVSAMVSAGATRLNNRVLAELMSRPDSPNLYWAIRELPPRYSTMRRSWDCETSWIYFQSQGLRRFAAGETLTADEWRKVLTDDMLPIYTIIDNYDFKNKKVNPHPDPIKDASPDTVQKARTAYAESHKVSADDAAKVDPAIVLGEFYLREARIAIDNVGKLRVLPYPQLLPRLAQVDAETIAFKKNNSTNPLREFASTLHKAIWTMSRTDRQTAALAAVEAIRSYAAENGGALPKSLDDVKETPVPENPATGKPFEYRVENDVATLSDTKSESPLTYTIKIRK
jgi:hypothetical protein